MIHNAIQKAYDRFNTCEWNRIYIALDIHGTVANPDYTDVSTKLYNNAVEPLQVISNLPEVSIILFSCCYPTDYAKYYSLKEFRYNNITQPNRNRLLWLDPTVDGMKTGHTEAAGWCLVASAKRGERRLLSVVLGALSDAGRAAESQKLLNFGFQAFDTVQLYQSGKPVSALKVWKGAEREVNAGFLADRYITLPRGRAGDLKLTLEALEPLVAPVSRGQRVGVVRVALDGRAMAEFPLIALDEVGPANVFVRAWDSVRLWFK